jgi:hypothetical protein
MAQYPIPQFIETEGKIIPFLTFRQFFILIGGGGICLVLYYLVPFALFLILALFVGAITAIVAFLKVDNTSVVKILFDFISFSATSKNYTWKKKESAYPFKIRKGQAAQNMQGLSAASTQASGLQNIKKTVELRKKI